MAHYYVGVVSHVVSSYFNGWGRSFRQIFQNSGRDSPPPLPPPPSPRLPISWWLQENLLNNHIIKISKGKYRYFKYDFNEKNNYAHNFDEKHILLWCDEKEVSDESSNTRQIKFINFKNVSHNLGEKLLPTQICLWCTLTCLRTKFPNETNPGVH